MPISVGLAFFFSGTGIVTKGLQNREMFVLLIHIRIHATD